jgi:hypothetical protein
MATDLSKVPAGPAGIPALKEFLATDTAEGADPETIKAKEQAITQLTDLLVQTADAKGLKDLLSQLRGFFNVIPKAKTAKIVRNIIDSIAKVPGSTDLQVGDVI